MQRGFLGPHMKIPTGVEGLDRMLHGGLLPGRPYLLVGEPGTGKTTLALEFLLRGVRQGEEVLYVTLEEPPNEIRNDFRGFGPDLGKIWVFDAIPDVMRYEKAPFKDIAAVRSATRLESFPEGIRRTGEFSSVEVTFSALIQTLKMESVRRLYSRMVIDSLTSLEYFCMKGFDEQQGAQAFLRFLSDLGITTLLTVETPPRSPPTAERLLARGEIHLFHWSVEGRAVRALGIEKFRGSAHDPRLHPFRLSAHGLDVDTQVSIVEGTLRTESVPVEAEEAVTAPAETELMIEARRAILAIQEDVEHLIELGLDADPVRQLLTAAHASISGMHTQAAFEQILEARQVVNHLLLAHEVSREFSGRPLQPTLEGPPAFRRLGPALPTEAGTTPEPVPVESIAPVRPVSPSEGAQAMLPLLGRLVEVLESSRGASVRQNLPPSLVKRAVAAAAAPAGASAARRTGATPAGPGSGRPLQAGPAAGAGIERVRLPGSPPVQFPGRSGPGRIPPSGPLPRGAPAPGAAARGAPPPRGARTGPGSSPPAVSQLPAPASVRPPPNGGAPPAQTPGDAAPPPLPATSPPALPDPDPAPARAGGEDPPPSSPVQPNRKPDPDPPQPVAPEGGTP